MVFGFVAALLLAGAATAGVTLPAQASVIWGD
jgi:hypothetical protein